MFQKDKIFIEFNQHRIESFKKVDLYCFLKENIFSGKIIILRSNKNIFHIINYVENILNNSFPEKNIIKILEDKNYFKEKLMQEKFVEIQKKIKNSNVIKKYFKNLLINLGFEIEKTFTDQICLRYNPGLKNENVGNLKLTPAHRDTWASNLFEQINWWFPLHDIIDENSIYICPKYFNKFVKNNSSDWSFDDFLKNKKNYSSTPISEKDFKKKDKILIKVKKGDLIFFSGHHIHGSSAGIINRINIENRTISLGDKKFNIPQNLDGMVKDIKTIWFKNLKNGRNLKKVY